MQAVFYFSTFLMMYIVCTQNVNCTYASTVVTLVLNSDRSNEHWCIWYLVVFKYTLDLINFVFAVSAPACASSAQELVMRKTVNLKVVNWKGAQAKCGVDGVWLTTHGVPVNNVTALRYTYAYIIDISYRLLANLCIFMPSANLFAAWKFRGNTKVDTIINQSMYFRSKHLPFGEFLMYPPRAKFYVRLPKLRQWSLPMSLHELQSVENSFPRLA